MAKVYALSVSHIRHCLYSHTGRATRYSIGIFKPYVDPFGARIEDDNSTAFSKDSKSRGLARADLRRHASGGFFQAVPRHRICLTDSNTDGERCSARIR
jgi:hypothetical protein